MYKRYVKKKKNVINMSKSHRHYVHLSMAAWQLFWFVLGSCDVVRQGGVDANDPSF